MSAGVKKEVTVKMENAEQGYGDGKVTGKRSRHPVGGTTATQQAYRVLTRDLVAKLEQILPENPNTAELVGEKWKRGAKTGRPRNVVLGDLVDIVQKIRMDEVALELAEKFRKKPRNGPPVTLVQAHAPTPTRANAPAAAMYHVGVPVADINFTMMQYGTHHQQYCHVSAPSSFPLGYPPEPQMAHVSYQPPVIAEGQAQHELPTEFPFVTSLPPTSMAHTTIDQSSILGGGNQDAEILAWLHEGVDTFTDAKVAKSMDEVLCGDEVVSFQEHPQSFWGDSFF